MMYDEGQRTYKSEVGSFVRPTRFVSPVTHSLTPSGFQASFGGKYLSMCMYTVQIFNFLPAGSNL